MIGRAGSTFTACNPCYGDVARCRSMKVIS